MGELIERKFIILQFIHLIKYHQQLLALVLQLHLLDF